MPIDSPVGVTTSGRVPPTTLIVVFQLVPESARTSRYLRDDDPVSGEGRDGSRTPRRIVRSAVKVFHLSFGPGEPIAPTGACDTGTASASASAHASAVGL